MKNNKAIELKRRIKTDPHKTPVRHVMDVYGFDKEKAVSFYRRMYSSRSARLG